MILFRFSVCCEFIFFIFWMFIKDVNRFFLRFIFHCWWLLMIKSMFFIFIFEVCRFGCFLIWDLHLVVTIWECIIFVQYRFVIGSVWALRWDFIFFIWDFSCFVRTCWVSFRLWRVCFWVTGVRWCVFPFVIGWDCFCWGFRLLSLRVVIELSGCFWDGISLMIFKCWGYFGWWTFMFRGHW